MQIFLNVLRTKTGETQELNTLLQGKNIFIPPKEGLTDFIVFFLLARERRQKSLQSATFLVYLIPRHLDVKFVDSLQK